MEATKFLRAAQEFVTVRDRNAKKFGDSRILRHDSFRFETDFCGPMFVLMADDYTRELINLVNRFFLDIFHSDCWAEAADSFEENDREVLIYEFVEPLCELCLYRPYMIRNQFVFASAQLLNLSNELKQSGWQDSLPPERKIGFKELCKVGKGWRSFPDFKDRLGRLNDKCFKENTCLFRDRMHHQFAIHIGRGFRNHLGREKQGNATVQTFGSFPPLRIKELVNQLMEQHLSAQSVFEGYWALLTEQVTEWKKAERKHAIRVSLGR